MKPSRSWKPFFYAALCLLVAIAAIAVRIRAAFNDLWLDEIWSIELVRELHSALGVFTQTHHDNNHYLNSLFIYSFGQHGNWPGYRILSEITGIGTIGLAWLIGARRDKCTAFYCMSLISCSYVLILYSSEARGYAPLVFFCFWCFLILASFLDRPSWQKAALFSFSAILGFTAHLTFFIFLSASLIWFFAGLLRRRFTLAQIAAWASACYAAPLIYLATLYFVDLRYLQIGGGTPITVLDGYGATLAWALGGPNASAWQWLTGAISFLALLGGIALLMRSRSDEWIFFLSVIVVAPLSMPLFEHGTLHYVRYFIVAFAFLLLELGWVLAWLSQSGRIGKIAAGVFCLLFLALNSSAVGSLLKYGRGHISAAVNFMAQNARDQQVLTFGGEQDFRTQFILGFYWRELMGNKAAEYYDHDHWPAEGPEWVIFHTESFRRPVSPGAKFTDQFGNWFELVSSYPTAPLSGIHLFLYQKKPTSEVR